MTPGQRTSVFLLGGLALIAGASGATGAAADAVFWAPASVQADGAGQFSFTAVLTAGDGCVGWTGYGYVGVENVTGGMWADTFCVDPQPIANGEVVTFEVTGRLTDPRYDGVMHSESYFCTGGGGFVETEVRAPSVPNEPDTWGALKARYR